MGLQIVYTISAALLVAAIQFTLGLSVPAYVLAGGGLMQALLIYALWRLRDVDTHSWLEDCLPGVAAVTGILLGGLARPAQAGAAFTWDAVAALLAALMSALIIWRRHRRSSPACRICQKPLVNYQYWRCPACAEAVCDRRSCWRADALRCADCHRLGRPLLTLEDEAWWQERLGARALRAQCQRCHQSSREVDVRNCGHCPSAMCLRCWDVENGLCRAPGCDWRIADLPELLERLLDSAPARRSEVADPD